MSADWQAAWQAVIHHPLFAFGLTLGSYQLAMAADKAPWWTLQRYTDGQIVAVYFWAVLHDRPNAWACPVRPRWTGWTTAWVR